MVQTVDWVQDVVQALDQTLDHTVANNQNVVQTVDWNQTVDHIRQEADCGLGPGCGPGPVQKSMHSGTCGYPVCALGGLEVRLVV